MTDPQPVEDAQRLQRWQALTALYWSGLCCAGLSILKPLIVGSLIDAYHYSARDAGAISGFEMAGIGVGALAVSWLGTGWRRHTAIRIGASLGIIGSLAPWVAGHFPALFLLRGLAGVGSGLVAAVVLGTIARTPRPDRNFGFYFIFCHVLSAALFPLAAAVITHSGADGSYYILAALLVTLFVTPRWIPDGAVARLGPAGDLPPFPFGQAALSLGVSIFFFIGDGAIWSFTERLGLQAGESRLQIGSILAAAQFAYVGGAGIAALIGTRLGRLLPTFAAIAISICGLALFSRGDAWSYVIAVLLLAFSWNVFLVYLNGLMSSQDAAGRVASLSVSSQTIGMAIGPAVGGVLAGTYGYGVLPRVGIAAHAVALVMLGLLALYRPRPAPRATRQLSAQS